MTARATIGCDSRGSAAIEFAIAAPSLLLMIFGILQIGQLMEARAGLKYAIDESARYATIFPRPTDAAILNKFDARRFGLNANLLSKTVVPGSAPDGAYIDIVAAYTVKPNFVFFSGPNIQLNETRRVYQTE